MPRTFDHFCTYAVNGRPLPSHERGRRQRIRQVAEEWAARNAASYATYEEAHDACKFVLVGTFVGLIINAIVSWIIWKVLDHYWNGYAPEPPLPEDDEWATE